MWTRINQVIHRDIPGGIWAFLAMVAIAWHAGTEFPYQDQHWFAKGINWYAQTLQIGHRYYDNRYQQASNLVNNTPRPCLVCWIEYHKFQEARKRALEMEEKARVYQEKVARGTYPVRSDSGFDWYKAHHPQKKS